MSTQTVTKPNQAQASGQGSLQLGGTGEPQVHFSELARGDRNGTLKLRGVPTFDDPHKKRQWVKEHMAAVFRFFGKKGYAEGIAGHISVRDPVLKGHLWFNPYAKHFSAMKASDLVLVDPEGYVVEGGNQAVVNTAGFVIHSAVHNARPDVHAACHVHSMYGKTWSAFGKPVEMLTQDACNLYKKQGVYEDHGGTVLAPEEGQNIAKALGPDNMVCILQNHGLLTTGTTVDEAGFLFYSLEQACHSQLLAEAAAANGVKKNIIGHEAAAFTAAGIQNQDSLYIEFQPEFDLIVEESNGRVLM